MKPTEAQIQRLRDFLDYIESETYPEIPSEVHDTITRQMTDHFFSRYRLPAQAAILDVGCGQGAALAIFRERGYTPIGITLNQEDVAACRAKGFEVHQMDQSFLDFENECFDFIWNRHCIEHSILPFYTLHEMKRVLKPGGYLYLEVPAPDTSSMHQANPNHYSVMNKSMWTELIQRAGFLLQETSDLDFTVDAGPDRYFAFVAKKP